MFITRLKLHNWRNFRDIDIELQRRVFIVGANATGKSNLLDALRFLRDAANPKGGGLQSAVNRRGGFRELRSRAADRSDDHLALAVELRAEPQHDGPPDWSYALRVKQERNGRHGVLVEQECVTRGGEVVLVRPDGGDMEDRERLTQTALEQVNANREFRPIAEFFASIQYLHLLPQMLRHAQDLQSRPLSDDPYGQGFLDQVVRTPKRTREARLNRIENALRSVVPQLSELRAVRDEAGGGPRLEVRFEHWRSREAWQPHGFLSDGTLRLVALLWIAQETGGPLLLEEPETSLHDSVVRALPGAFASLAYGWRSNGRHRPRQVWMSTHSPTLLQDDTISLQDVVLLRQGTGGTRTALASEEPMLCALHEAGHPLGDAVVPWTGAMSPQLARIK